MFESHSFLFKLPDASIQKLGLKRSGRILHGLLFLLPDASIQKLGLKHHKLPNIICTRLPSRCIHIETRIETNEMDVDPVMEFTSRCIHIETRIETANSYTLLAQHVQLPDASIQKLGLKHHLTPKDDILNILPDASIQKLGLKQKIGNLVTRIFSSSRCIHIETRIETL